jgi:hypothetical protein
MVSFGVEPFYFLGDPIVGSLKAGCAAAYNFTARHFSLVSQPASASSSFPSASRYSHQFHRGPDRIHHAQGGIDPDESFMLDFGYHFRAPEDVRKFNVSLA